MKRFKHIANVREAKVFFEAKLVRLFRLMIRQDMPFAIHDKALIRIALDVISECLKEDVNQNFDNASWEELWARALRQKA